MSRKGQKPYKKEVSGRPPGSAMTMAFEMELTERLISDVTANGCREVRVVHQIGAGRMDRKRS